MKYFTGISFKGFRDKIKNIKFNGIRTKLAVVLIVIAVLIVSIVSWFNYQRASIILKDEITYALTNSAEHNAHRINNWLKGVKNEVDSMANTPVVKSMEWEKQLPVLREIAQKQDEYGMFMVADSQGNAHSTNTLNDLYNISDREYFKQVMKTGKPYIGDPVKNKATYRMVIPVASPVKEEASTKGVILATVSLNYLKSLVIRMDIGDNGYGFIVNDDMSVLAHPNEELVNNKKIWNLSPSLKQASHILEKGESGFSDYIYKGYEKEMAYHPIELTGWSVVQTAKMDDIMAPLSKIKKQAVTFMLFAIAIMLLVSIVVTSYVTRPITSLNKKVSDVAGGDLTKSVDTGRKDEVGSLSSSFEIMINNLKSVILEIKNYSNKLTSHSRGLASYSEEVTAAVEEVACTTSDVASMSNRGVENTSAAAEESEQVMQAAEKGNKAVQETVDKINSIAMVSQNASNKVQKLGDQSGQIEQIINTITSIADKTNLLALNAAIEAARAGEHGKGFAVVADEVRKLAEQTANSTGEITNLIEDIQNGVNEAIEAMDQGTREVKEGVEIANNAGAALEQIKKAVDKNTSVINDIAEGIKQSSAGVQQLSSSSEQITSTVQQVSSSAKELANIAEELNHTVAKFKVKETGES
ncbi:MAG: methyl-accepting chemotaxis protein [Clostridiales bacterium]|nr:methyl-accepting chemotaxis protein [Clostridiales bacterium]MCF8022427.1 methyl-accepting chemotaxis protein [Clostridiales bacterium]